ncbi:phosphoribosyltransferase domain-containing protein, partial [Actinomadura sp. HBU206391]|nr:phosphoribosyltransferase domain-containing protein [Actinomadura sp. HBU206391]
MRNGGAWTGRWVARRLDVALRDLHRPVGAGLADLLGLAVRRNPRRAHLLVSAVLGKHVPTDPRLVRGAGLLLGELVRSALSRTSAEPANGSPGHVGLFAEPLIEALKGRPDAAAGLRDRLETTGPALAAVVVGYAETATALGHCVADALGGAYYVHSTRRAVPGVPAYGGFEEEHSHATSHLLLPADLDRMDAALPVVLVDDEVSTGTTALNTIRALHAVRPRRHYVVASLVDVRRPADRAATDALAAALGTRIETVALAAGEVLLPEDVLGAA